MADISIDVEVICDECRNPVDIMRETGGSGSISLRVSPCETCLQKAEDKGYSKAKSEGEE